MAMSSRKELLAAVLDRLELWFRLLDETPGELQGQSCVSHGAKMCPLCRQGWVNGDVSGVEVRLSRRSGASRTTCTGRVDGGDGLTEGIG